MKKMIKTSIIAAVMCTVIITNANSFSPFLENGNPTTHLTFENLKEGAKLVIKDHNGLILYKEMIKKSGGYSKNFDLTALPEGNYYFELDQQMEIKVIPFTVASNAVIFNKEEEITINKPKVIVKGNHVLVSRLSMDKKPLEVKIYYEDYDLVYVETLKNTQELRRVYDFSTAIEGLYTIVLKAEGRRFTVPVKI